MMLSFSTANVSARISSSDVDFSDLSSASVTGGVVSTLEDADDDIFVSTRMHLQACIVRLSHAMLASKVFFLQ